MRLGRYETLRAIATGGMATVHLGRSVGAGGFERLVAIKVMHPHIADDPDFVTMFLDEARLAARIRHPNVVGTLDIQKEGETLFLVMDYVEGPSLSQMNRALRKQGQILPVGITTRVFMDVLSGLHAAHELTGEGGKPLGLVHRDMSPPNILVGHEGISRITDFGVARANARLTMTRGGQVKGKLQYMAPEQARSDTMDRRTDIYAAGIVLWETLAGKRLFDADNEMALSQMILEGARSSPRDHNPSVPQSVSNVCMRALSVDPGQRFPTALAFADSLEDAARVAGTPIGAPRAVASYVKAMELHEPPGDLDLPSETAPVNAPPTPAAAGGIATPTGALVTPPAPYSPAVTPPLAPPVSVGSGVQSAVTGPTTAGTTLSARPKKGRAKDFLLPAALSAGMGVFIGAVAVFGPWGDAPEAASPALGGEALEASNPAVPTTKAAAPQLLQRAGNAAPPSPSASAGGDAGAAVATDAPEATTKSKVKRPASRTRYPSAKKPANSTFRPDDL